MPTGIPPMRKVLIRIQHCAPGITSIIAINPRNAQSLQTLPRKTHKVSKILARSGRHKKAPCPRLAGFKRKLDFRTNFKSGRPYAWPQPGHDV